MARILIAENSPAVRRLLEVRLEQLRHEPVRWEDGVGELDTIDVVLVEPAQADALSFARRVRRDHPDVALVISSVRGRTLETASLRPDAHLVKPFALSRLQRALDHALARAWPMAQAS